MRLLNTLYVLGSEKYVHLDGENIVVKDNGVFTGRFPLHNLEAVAYFGDRGASPQLLAECAKRNIDFCLFSPHGVFRARVCGLRQGSVYLRKNQYRIANDEELSLGMARNVIIGKIHNSRWTLERSLRDHPLQINESEVSAVSARLVVLLRMAKDCVTVEELRGLEGAAAQAYFSVFDNLILTPDVTMRFTVRTRRPPLDRVNAVLSFAYSLLTNTYGAALEGVGLDPFAGMMHCDRAGRKSLALDLVEELRSVFADRVVLNCINNRILKEDHFDVQENGATLLNDDGRKAFLQAWQSKKQTTISHPFLGLKIPWGLVPHVQAQLLASYFRGDIDEYPPFLWK